MSTRDQVESGVLVYTCNCGWLDTGHSDSRSRRPHVGAQSLWNQILNETGKNSLLTQENGFKVTYRQEMTKWGVSPGETRDYFVVHGMNRAQKETVALAIFQEVSVAFEAMQGTFPYSLSAGSADSSFSEEDLVSDLIGFYLAVRSGINQRVLCNAVTKDQSLQVWDTYGSVGSHKNETWTPMFHPCDGCRGRPRFPATFQAITPDPKGNYFRDWRMGTTVLGFHVGSNVDEYPGTNVILI